MLNLLTPAQSALLDDAVCVLARQESQGDISHCY
jgi:hypothetical protein